MQRWLAFAVLTVCLFVPACSGDGQGAIKGSVTLDDQPVPNGSILFVRLDDSSREGSVVKDGAFQLKARPGTYRVEVNARKVIGKKIDTSFGDQPVEIEETEELIPERYNKNSELTFEVKPGDNTVKLDLKSQ